PWPPTPARSRPAPPPVASALPSTTSSSASKSNWATRPAMPAGRPSGDGVSEDQAARRSPFHPRLAGGGGGGAHQCGALPPDPRPEPPGRGGGGRTRISPGRELHAHGPP